MYLNKGHYNNSIYSDDLLRLSAGNFIDFAIAEIVLYIWKGEKPGHHDFFVHFTAAKMLLLSWLFGPFGSSNNKDQLQLGSREREALWLVPPFIPGSYSRDPLPFTV